jgi:hypothetical protein
MDAASTAAAILLAVLVAGCASQATAAHSFLRVTEQRRGESLAIRAATQSEANIARTTKSRVTFTPTRCAGVGVSATRLTCSVTFEVVDGSDEHKVTVVLDPKTGVMKRHEVIALATQFFENERDGGDFFAHSSARSQALIGPSRYWRFARRNLCRYDRRRGGGRVHEDRQSPGTLVA